MVVGSSLVTVTQASDLAPASSKVFLDTQASIECGFTLKRICGMIITSRLNDVMAINVKIARELLTDKKCQLQFGKAYYCPRKVTSKD